MDIVTLGAALNGSAEYVNSHFKGGSNIQIVDNPDGTQTINASGEVSSEDTVARAEIAEMKDGETLDSFGDVETALATKANTATTYTKTEVDTALNAKANSADVYSKTAVDTALGNKADKSTTYTKTEVDTAMSAKADKSTTYTKTEVDTTLGNKADKSTTYTKTEVDTALSAKANTATTYTKTEVDTALGGKVDKETGKGLSTNDYTTAEKTKLDDLAEIKSIGTGLNLDSSTGELTATGGGGGTSDYSDLTNKPQINSVTLSGNKSLSDLGITYESETAASGGTALSLVTTGEKYAWNNKQNTISDLSAIRNGAALGSTAVQPETGKGLSTNDYTTAEKTKLAGIANGAEVNVQSNWTQTTTTADDYIKNKPTLGTAAAKNATDTYNATGTDVTTGKAVAAALATLPEPMVFKGSLGTGGTITTLPTASGSNKGYVYKVITAGTYASRSAKVGDTFISDGSAWVLIPSGDEPSGTVTNVAVTNGGGLTVSGSPITSSGTITVGHSNSVTAKTSSSLKKFTYDKYGHVTGSSELSTAESNALASGIDSTKVAQIETNQNNISKDEAALVELVDGGAKNMANPLDACGYLTQDSSYPITVGGVTFTLGVDGSITNSGSSTSARALRIPVTLPAGTYHFGGTPSGGGSSSGRIDIREPSTETFITTTTDTGEGFFYTFDATTSFDFCIRIAPNYTESITFKPMICTEAAWKISQAYQPHRPSYQELYEMVKALQANQ